MRVSDITKNMVSLNNVNRASSSYDDILTKLSSQKNILKGHEDPALAQKAMKYEDHQIKYAQYIKNNDDAKSTVNYTEDTLGTVSSLLIRMKEIVTQSATGTISPESRKALSQEVNELIKESSDLGNQTLNGKYLFSGTNTTTKPFTLSGDPPTGITYNGNSNKIYYELNDNFKTDINVPGDSVFSGLINNLISVRDHIDSNDTVALSGADMTNVNSDINNVISIRTNLGAKANVIDINTDRLKASSNEMEKMYAGIMDVDVTKATVDYTLRQNNLQATLSIISKVSQLSLADYLK